MPPKSLKNTTYYRYALLWLMGELSSARVEEVMNEFLRRFSQLIPPDDYGNRDTGDIIWQHVVRWSRQDLVSAGLMESGGWGIWAITDDGRKWLQQNPDGDPQKLISFIHKNRKNINSSTRSTAKSPQNEKTAKLFVRQISKLDKQAHSILDRQIGQIRQFLNGRSSVRPSDEQLCDWVQFCYLFELYSEGSELFRYVDQNRVDPWQYRRTNKYAQACLANLRKT